MLLFFLFMQYNVVLDPIEFDYTDKTFFTFLQFRFHWINAHLYFLAEEIPSYRFGTICG